MKKLNNETEKRIASAIYNVELACGKCSQEEIELIRKSAYGEISDEEFRKQVLSEIGSYQEQAIQIFMI